MDQTQLLVDVLRAEANGNDLYDSSDGFALFVCAERKDGSLYQLGSVSANLILSDPAAARHAISRIKFTPRR